MSYVFTPCDGFFFLFLFLWIWGTHVKEIRLILRREATCSIISKGTSSAWPSNNKRNRRRWEKYHNRDRSIFVRKYESHPKHKWNKERKIGNHLFDFQLLPSMTSRRQTPSTHNPFQYVVFSTSKSPLSGNSALDDPTSTSYTPASLAHASRPSW